VNFFFPRSKDSTIRFWDIRSGLAVNTYRSHLSEVTSVAVSDRGDRLLSASKIIPTDSGIFDQFVVTDPSLFRRLPFPFLSVGPTSLSLQGTPEHVEEFYPGVLRPQRERCSQRIGGWICVHLGHGIGRSRPETGRECGRCVQCCVEFSHIRDKLVCFILCYPFHVIVRSHPSKFVAPANVELCAAGGSHNNNCKEKKNIYDRPRQYMICPSACPVQKSIPVPPTQILRTAEHRSGAAIAI
jgi:hypothetical protein